MESKNSHGRINLGSNNWLFFDRTVGDLTNVISVSHVDNETSTISLLAELRNGVWVTSNNPNAYTIWKLFKEHSKSVKRIMKNLNEPVDNHVPLSMEWKCLKRRFHFQIVKFKRKFSK